MTIQLQSFWLKTIKPEVEANTSTSKYLSIRERVKDKTVIIEHVNTELMIVDPLTKGMPPSKFKDHTNHMGLGLLV